ncbi:hypothetical protein FOA52_013741 [Chlamydomonas sp. UWO 241]|nr:hypothetical protein FOA52_013741 [Chlamydomonas sp. UWO 241]
MTSATASRTGRQGSWTPCTKGRKKVVGWVNESSEYPRSGSEVSEGDCMFLMVPG